MFVKAFCLSGAILAGLIGSTVAATLPATFGDEPYIHARAAHAEFLFGAFATGIAEAEGDSSGPQSSWAGVPYRSVEQSNGGDGRTPMGSASFDPVASKRVGDRQSQLSMSVDTEGVIGSFPSKSVEMSPVPLPSSLPLFAGAILGLGFLVRSRRTLVKHR